MRCMRSTPRLVLYSVSLMPKGYLLRRCDIMSWVSALSACLAQLQNRVGYTVDIERFMGKTFTVASLKYDSFSMRAIALAPTPLSFPKTPIAFSSAFSRPPASRLLNDTSSQSPPTARAKKQIVPPPPPPKNQNDNRG